MRRTSGLPAEGQPLVVPCRGDAQEGSDLRVAPLFCVSHAMSLVICIHHHQEVSECRFR